MRKQILLMVGALGVLALIAVFLFRSGSGSEAEAIEATTASAPIHVTAGSSDTPPPADVRASATEREAPLGGDTAAAPSLDSGSASSIAEGQSLDVLVVAKKDGRPLAGADVACAGLDEESVRSFWWSWMRDGELEERIGPLASRTTTDGEGNARFPKPVESAIVVARAGELWGCANFGKRSESPFRVELLPDADLSALVVDLSGRSVAGARVTLRSNSGGGWFYDAMSASSRAGDGLAVLRHAGYSLRSDMYSGDRTWQVALGAVLEKPVEVPIDADELPEEPIRLVMPATGECEVRVLDTGGQPFDGELEVTLRVLDREESVDDFVRRNWGSGFALHEVQGGIALFRHVEPGRAFEATAEQHGSNQEHRARGLGPVAAGQRAVLTLRIGERSPVVTGRALDASGALLREQKLLSRIEREGSQGQVESAWLLRSDAEGRFAVDLPEEFQGKATRALTVYTVDGDGAELAAATRPLPEGLEPGRHDLGDFVLQPSQLLVSGVVVDEQGQPVARADITPATKRVRDESWQQLWSHSGTSDDQGRFEIRGRAEADEIGVWAAKGELKGTAVIVSAGASNVVLRLAATGEIAGVVLLDPSVPREALDIYVERAGIENDPSDRWSPPVQPDEEGKFTVEGLKPARYTVRLQSNMGWRSPADVAEVADVAVTGGTTTRDPRLDPLDLRASLRAFRLEIVDEEDSPIEQGVLVMHEGSDGDHQSDYAPIRNGKAVVLHSGGGVDLTVMSGGFRDVVLLAVTSDQRVVLRRAIEIRLVLAQGLRAPEPPLSLSAWLEPVEAEPHSDRIVFGEEPCFDARGVQRSVSQAVGRFRVTLMLTRRGDDWETSTELSEDAERIIDVADTAEAQTFEISFDPAELERATARLPQDG